MLSFPEKGVMSNDILHLSFSSTGGAGVVASSISEYQKNLKFKSIFKSTLKKGIRDAIFTNPFLVFTSLIDFYFVRNRSSLVLFTLFRRSWRTFASKSMNLNYDVLHLHWLPGVISFEDLGDLVSNFRTTVWTFHDMWPITGGCHHSFNCEKFLNSCCNCPQSRPLFYKKISASRNEKIDFFRSNERLIITVPSKWLFNRVQSFLNHSDLKNQIILVRNPIDIKKFSPTSVEIKNSIRKKMDFREQSLLLGFNANNLADPLKNLELITSYVDRFNSSSILKVDLLVLGNNCPKSFNGPRHHYLGTDSTTSLTDFYRVIDIFINLSKMENLPTNVLESQSCGLPSLVSKNGGLPETIIPGKTGYVISNFSEFRDALNNLSKISSRDSFGKEARKFIAENFSIEVVEFKYRELYDSWERI
jgi:glycosyltransferase involved in cell wall biosynthesis